MYFVYVLKSIKDGKLYTGWTPDIKKRLEEHEKGLVASTKVRRPLKMIFCEIFTDKKDSLMREKFLKSGWGRRHLGIALKNTLAV